MSLRNYFYKFNLIALTIVTSSFCHAKRVALIIGNSDYKLSPLTNPVNDAQDFEAKLKKLGFNGNIIKVENLKKSNIGRTIREFTSKIQEGDEVVFFYAGHGIQLKGINYLPAVDADIQSEDDVALNSINVAQLLDRLEEAKSGVKLIFLDACRNNPFARGFRSLERGLNRMGDAPSGTLISFATRPGSVAADGIGRNGLYTSHLLKYIETPRITVESLLKKVSSSVSIETNRKQEPWIEGSISGEFYFQNEAAPINKIENEQSLKLDSEKNLWEAIKYSTTTEPFIEYIKHYPNGMYLSEARVLTAKINALEKLKSSSKQKSNEEQDVLAWNSASKEGLDGFLFYKKLYPNGIYIKIAEENISKIYKNKKLEEEDGLWIKANDKSGVISYLSQFPDGRYVNSAKIRLLDFEKIELEAERERKKTQQKPQVHVIPSVM